MIHDEENVLADDELFILGSFYNHTDGLKVLEHIPNKDGMNKKPRQGTKDPKRQESGKK